MIDPGLVGKVVLITGANNPLGIGAATARAFATQGADVFLHYWRLRTYIKATDGSAAEVEADVRERGARVASWEADLGEASNVAALFDRAEAELGPVDVFINNASHWTADTFLPADLGTKAASGRSWPPPSETVSIETHDRHFAVNSRATALLLAEYARRYLARGATWGRVVGLTTGGAPGGPGEISYGASKSALESYTRTFALELAKHGVTANLVNPGACQTGWISPELQEQISSTGPMGRVSQPDEVADVIVFLCSDQARLLTGQRIRGLGA
jgi:3-oxoacyl-[acyl-carrier protein] reductase